VCEELQHAEQSSAKVCEERKNERARALFAVCVMVNVPLQGEVRLFRVLRHHTRGSPL